MKDPRHILELSCGLTVELTLDEATGMFNCEWSPHLPTKNLLPVIEKEYIPWRNAIVEAWAERTGKKVLVVSRPINIARLNYQEADYVIRFQKLCVEKFGQQFQQDENFRHQAVDLLLAAVENIDK